MSNSLGVGDARGLPDELISLIVDHIHPGDLIPFALGCHRFHALISDRLLQHHARHAKYKHIVISSRYLSDSEEDYKQYEHPLEYLAELERDPSLAYYPQMLDYDEILHAFSEEVVENTAYDFPILYKLSPLLQHDIDFTESSIDGIRRGDANDCLMLILSLATELEYLRTWHGMQGRNWLAMAAAMPEGLTCCQKLSWVQASSIIEERRGVNELVHWAQLPRLEFLSLVRPEAVNSVQRCFHDWPPLQQRRSLPDFHLLQSQILGVDVAKILSGVTDLQNFTFTDGQHAMQGWQWQTDLAINALTLAASHSLRSLTLHMPWPPEDRMTSLKDFQKLELFSGPFDIMPTNLIRGHDVQAQETLDVGAIFPTSLVRLSLNTRSRASVRSGSSRSIELSNTGSCSKLRCVRLTPCELSQGTIEVLHAASVIIQYDWEPTDHGDMINENTLPPEYWLDPIFDQE